MGGGGVVWRDGMDGKGCLLSDLEVIGSISSLKLYKIGTVILSVGTQH